MSIIDNYKFLAKPQTREVIAQLIAAGVRFHVSETFANATRVFELGIEHPELKDEVARTMQVFVTGIVAAAQDDIDAAEHTFCAQAVDELSAIDPKRLPAIAAEMAMASKRPIASPIQS